MIGQEKKNCVAFTQQYDGEDFLYCPSIAIEDYDDLQGSAAIGRLCSSFSIKSEKPSLLISDGNQKAI